MIAEPGQFAADADATGAGVRPRSARPAGGDRTVAQAAYGNRVAEAGSAPWLAARGAARGRLAGMGDNAFLDRVIAKVPRGAVNDYVFKHWSVAGKVTEEALGFLPVPGVDADQFLGRVMDLDHYTGPIPHVVESRAVADPRFTPPRQVRFYQRVKIPLLGEVHQELVIERFADIGGFQAAAWKMLEPETAALSPKTAIRGGYNDGAWLVGPGVVGYALSSAPRREDVGFIKWKALTAGADVAASKVIRDNIAAMAKWAAR